MRQRRRVTPMEAAKTQQGYSHEDAVTFAEETLADLDPVVAVGWIAREIQQAFEAGYQSAVFDTLAEIRGIGPNPIEPAFKD